MNLYAHDPTKMKSNMCFLGKHEDCNGYLKDMPRKKVNECYCNCHKIGYMGTSGTEMEDHDY